MLIYPFIFKSVCGESEIDTKHLLPGEGALCAKKARSLNIEVVSCTLCLVQYH